MFAIDTFSELHNIDPIAKDIMHLTAARRGPLFRSAMDPKRDFRLLGADALASEAKQFGISVATLKTLNTRTKPRYPNHDGTRFLDLSSDED
eukprot:jgi/Tetstr1/462043/TSEL_007114.t1